MYRIAFVEKNVQRQKTHYDLNNVFTGWHAEPGMIATLMQVKVSTTEQQW